jgi:hypothetical protein
MSDSYYIWTFTSNTGDQWGGTLYDDSSAYNVGSTVRDVAGTYVITHEYAFGFDLTAAYGINEGEVTTSWYYDSQAGQYFQTYSNGLYETGFAGLSSEYDYAWTGAAWDDFGDGGRYQANGEPADSYFTWTFYARGGDQWGGTLYDDSRDYAVGSVINDVNGYYLITSEYEFGFDLTAPYGIWEGEVTTSWYYDAGSRSYLETWSGGQLVTSWEGLGAEYDYAWNGWEWQDLGEGGIFQVDVPVYVAWDVVPTVTYDVVVYDTYDYGYYDYSYYDDGYYDYGYDDGGYYDYAHYDGSYYSWDEYGYDDDWGYGSYDYAGYDDEYYYG